MGKGHAHHHHHHTTADASTRNIGFAFWLNLLFAVIELVGGVYTQSLAIISDALHDFGDALSLGLGYILQKKSSVGPSENFSYGLRRLSLLSAVFSGVFISVGGIFIIYKSLSSLSEPGEPNGLGMIVLAIFGVAVNGLAAWRLGLGHTHNEQMLKWHLIEDILGWIAVLIGALLIQWVKWNWLDPVLAIGISLFVLFNVTRNLIDTVNLFLQGNPDPEGLRQFRTHVEELENVLGLHDVHFWSLDGVRHILSLHVVLKDLVSADLVKDHIRRLSNSLGDCHVTIEIEGPDFHCHNDCEHVHQ